MNLREAYENSLNRGTHDRDPAQDAIVTELCHLQQQLEARARRSPGFLSFLRRNSANTDEPIRGLYVWGGVGRGKTFLMDLFYETLAVDAKQRIHFHRMLQAVHGRLAKLGDIEDPLDQVAADIAADVQVLCFDEFFVSDIGDAMILGRLLDGLFRRCLLYTSDAADE